MSTSSEKNSVNGGDSNLVTLKEWIDRNPRTISGDTKPECPHICRMREGVIKRLYKEDTLEEESLGSGFAAMVKLGEALISIAGDTLKRIKTGIKKKIKNCLK